MQQNLRGDSFLFPEQPEQQMFGADIVVIELAGFIDGVLDHLLGPRGQWQSVQDNLIAAGAVSNDHLDFEPGLAKIDIEVLEHFRSDAATFLYEAEQDVLGPDVLVAKSLGLSSRQLHDLASTIRESLVQRRRSEPGWKPEPREQSPEDAHRFLLSTFTHDYSPFPSALIRPNHTPRIPQV